MKKELNKEQMEKQAYQEDKYYTPELEEFHLGFEYEVYASNGNEDKWIPSTWGIFQSLEYFRDLEYTLERAYRVKEEFTRVKYLDKEDIESLGWILDNRGMNYSHYNSKYLMQVYNTDIRIYNPGKENGTYTNQLNLKINNKSELKKLMKQLGIYEL